MHELPIFGITHQGKHDSAALENDFQDKLCHKLRGLTRDDNWHWDREVKHETSAFPEHQGILVDIVGRGQGSCIAVELKYVTHRKGRDGRRMHPSDRYAFSYDVVKDCAKLELLQHPGAELVKDRKVLWDAGGVQGVVIALTDWAQYWGEAEEGCKGLSGGWSKNFSHLLAKRDGPVRLPGENIGRVIKTTGRNSERTIYGPHAKRCHISLAQDWQGQWHDFGAPENGFRYLLLANKPAKAPLVWEHQPKSPHTIPFLKKDALDAFHRECRRVQEKI